MSVNTTSVSAGEALATLDAAWEAQKTGRFVSSWMLHGRPGVGKTEIVQTLADRKGADLFDVRLTTIEPQDLRGLPYYDHETGKTVWYRPEDLPDRADRPTVLFLDELTAASPYLQPTVYGLLQERRVGRHRLPESVFIVAAGNSVEDGAVAYEMGTALSDRLVHLHVQANARDWLEAFAVDRGIHPMVAAFLKSRPDLLETTEETLRQGRLIACTPRSWERVSRIMEGVTDRRSRNVMIAGTVGEAVALEFARLTDQLAAGATVEEILEAAPGEREALMPRSVDGLVALIYALIAFAERSSIDRVIEVMASIRKLKGEGMSGLPLAELCGFGFELLIRKALDSGLEEAFRKSSAYRDYAREREAMGLG